MCSPKVIIETQYFPSIGWFVLGSSAGGLFIDRAENYNKRSLRNKTHLTQASTSVTLTVPLKKGKHDSRSIQDVQIAYDENWTINHIRAIKSTYGKSPYYIHYSDEITAILEKRYNLLFDLNTELIVFLIRALKLELDINFAADFIKYSTTDSLLFRDQVRYTKSFMPIEDKLESRIMKWRGKTHLPYNINPRSSILDLLFYLGPESRLFLNKVKLSMSMIEDCAIRNPAIRLI